MGIQRVDSNCNYLLFGPRIHFLGGDFTDEINSYFSTFDPLELKMKFYTNMPAEKNYNDKYLYFVQQDYIVMGRNKLEAFDTSYAYLDIRDSELNSVSDQSEPDLVEGDFGNVWGTNRKCELRPTKDVPGVWMI